MDAEEKIYINANEVCSLTKQDNFNNKISPCLKKPIPNPNKKFLDYDVPFYKNQNQFLELHASGYDKWNKRTVVVYIAVYSYQSSSKDCNELSFERGALIKGRPNEIPNYNDWIRGAYKKKIGWFPSNYVREIVYKFIPEEQISYNQNIGYGQFCKIETATYYRHKKGSDGSESVVGFDVACKSTKTKLSQSYHFTKWLEEEATVLSLLDHINVIKFYGIIIDDKDRKKSLILELCQGDTLAALIFDPIRFIEESVKAKLMLQVADGMAYIHNEPKYKYLGRKLSLKEAIRPSFIHRDLKPQNIFVAEKLCVCAGEPITNSKFCEYCGYILDYRNVTLKIGDFGLTTTDDEVNLINIGTTGYCAPEASNGMFTTKSDVFSFSMIMWEFITHKKAFAKLNSNNITYEIGKCEDRLPLLEIPDCHDILLSIINNGLDWSPYKRMNFGEIIGRFSQYLKEDNSSSNTVEQFKALDIRQCPFLTKILDQQLSVNQVLKLSVDNKSYNLILKEDIHSIKDKASNCKYKLSKSKIPDESNLKHGHNILVQNEEYIPREMKNNESTIKIEEYSKREENAFKTDESTIKTDDSRVTDVEDDNVGEGKETNDFHSPIHADIVNSERKNKSNLFKSVINIFSKSKKKHSVKTESDSEKSEMKNSYSEKLENSKSAEEQSSLNETMISTDNKGNSLTNFIDLDSKPSKLKYYLKKLILKERVALPKIAEEEKAETLIKQLRKKKEKFFSRFSTEPFDEEFFDVEKYITCLNNNTLTDNTNPNNTTIDNNDKDHDYESSEISLVDLKDACRLGNVKRRKKKIKNNPRKFSRNVKMSTRVPNRISDSDGEYIGCKDVVHTKMSLDSLLRNIVVTDNQPPISPLIPSMIQPPYKGTVRTNFLESLPLRVRIEQIMETIRNEENASALPQYFQQPSYSLPTCIHPYPNQFYYPQSTPGDNQFNFVDENIQLQNHQQFMNPNQPPFVLNFNNIHPGPECNNFQQQNTNQVNYSQHGYHNMHQQTILQGNNSQPGYNNMQKQTILQGNYPQSGYNNTQQQNINQRSNLQPGYNIMNQQTISQGNYSQQNGRQMTQENSTYYAQSDASDNELPKKRQNQLNGYPNLNIQSNNYTQNENGGCNYRSRSQSVVQHTSAGNNLNSRPNYNSAREHSPKQYPIPNVEVNKASYHQFNLPQQTHVNPNYKAFPFGK